jgi:hypothetical protein
MKSSLALIHRSSFLLHRFFFPLTLVHRSILRRVPTIARRLSTVASLQTRHRCHTSRRLSERVIASIISNKPGHRGHDPVGTSIAIRDSVHWGQERRGEAGWASIVEHLPGLTGSFTTQLPAQILQRLGIQDYCPSTGQPKENLKMIRKLGLVTALVAALGCGSLALATTPKTGKTSATSASATATAKRKHRRGRRHGRRGGGMNTGGNTNANMTPKK